MRSINEWIWVRLIQKRICVSNFINDSINILNVHSSYDLEVLGSDIDRNYIISIACRTKPESTDLKRNHCVYHTFLCCHLVLNNQKVFKLLVSTLWILSLIRLYMEILPYRPNLYNTGLKLSLNQIIYYPKYHSLNH